MQWAWEHSNEHIMTLERQAKFANGLLVIASVVLAAIPGSRLIGLCCTAFMGSGLIFSGITSYCGWVRILPVLSRKLQQRNR